MPRSIVAPLIAIASFAVLSAPFQACAGDGGLDLYAGAGIGITDFRSTTVTDTASRSVTFDNGLMGALFLGTRATDTVRVEVELSRRAADLSRVSGTGASGDVTATSLMANALVDLDLGLPVTPYLGAGAGYGRVGLGGAGPFGTSTIDDTDWTFAWQGVAGATLTVREDLDLFADYRYFNAGGVDLNTRAGTSASLDLDAHNVLVGLRFHFGAPTSAKTASGGDPGEGAAEAAARALSEKPAADSPALPKADGSWERPYMVFFDWDRAEVTHEAGAVLEGVASDARKRDVSRMVLTGHADRSGTDEYNIDLSQRRADTVKAAFGNLGLKPTPMDTVAKGESDPLVPTADGVRESRNRRVEIVFP
ncbi:MAG: OmpA family protein [Alphaproteobacteria bacterium]|nr:OmpA family protein [Alphaproteobacteria bacterium]